MSKEDQSRFVEVDTNADGDGDDLLGAHPNISKRLRREDSTKKEVSTKKAKVSSGATGSSKTTKKSPGKMLHSKEKKVPISKIGRKKDAALHPAGEKPKKKENKKR
jgi:hypothetical protein